MLHKNKSDNSRVAIGLVVICILVFNLPNFLTYKIVETPLRHTCKITDPTVINALAYFPEISDLAMEKNCLVSFVLLETHNFRLF
jgi:hypothetical protein